jgi:hypothetical protein
VGNRESGVGQLDLNQFSPSPRLLVSATINVQRTERGWFSSRPVEPAAGQSVTSADLLCCETTRHETAVCLFCQKSDTSGHSRLEPTLAIVGDQGDFGRKSQSRRHPLT